MESDQNDDIPKVNEPTISNTNEHSLNQNVSTANENACDVKIDGESSSVNKHNDIGNLPSVPYVYREDIVRHKKSGAIGMVNEVAGGSDSDSDSDLDSDSSITDDEDDEDDVGEEDENEGGNAKNDGEAGTNAAKSKDNKKSNDTYKNGALLADQVRVSWMHDIDPVQHVNDIEVVDRGFLHGDYVASASDPIGQVGVVQDVHISVDLLSHDARVIKGVSSRDLRRVREFSVGDYVVLGRWLGRIDDVLDNVTVLIDDGSVCKVMGAEPLRLKPISRSFFDEDDNFPYYPGQRVRASSSSVFKNSRWLTGLWKANKLEGSVTKVTTGSVYVYWIASVGYGPDSPTAPAEEQNPKNLKLLSCFAHANWQLGDCCLLSLSTENSSSISLDNGLFKSELHGPVKKELDCSQQGNECDLEVDELDENNESMDIDPVVATDRNDGHNNSHISPESKSCSSSTSVSKEPVHETWPLHRKKIRRVVMRREKKVRKKEENFERALLIINTKTTVDIAWQDGSTELGVDSVKLIPIDSPGEHEFLAEQYVVEKASDDIDNASEPRRVGVVKSVNAKERTACVRWLKPVARPEDPREFDKEEIVSVYELEGHHDYDYSYGDVVVRLSPPSASMKTLGGESAGVSGADISKCSGFENGVDTLKNVVSPDFSDLSWVGNITGLRNGDIEVTWADGMISTVGPQAIFVVGRDDDDDTVAVGSEVSDAASWETVDDDETDALENSQEGVAPQNGTDVNSDKEESVENISSGRNPAFTFPLAALDFVARLASGIFSRGKRNDNQEDSDSKDENELQLHEISNISKDRNSNDDSSSQKSTAIENFGEQTAQGKAEDHVVSEIPVSADAAEAVCNLRVESDVPMHMHSEHDACNFKRFDTATDPLDHYFLDSNTQVNSGRKWLKKVQQDWNILQNNLPDGIYVRVYEDRMDLIRAVIVGAYGTPYQDGLFFFDFHLPPEYPDVPPSVHYHSGGWRINPNLYEEGKVCLSLLNTWTGRGNEVWDPISSSILQVLVSLQGLVLNSKPYFNEAGYDKQIGTAEGEKNSLSYNENTFLLNCKTMMYLMRRPPKDFEELIKDHFRRRGYYILKACDAYMRGSLIGSLTKDASVSKEEKSDLNSVGFKLMLAKIVPKLYSSLQEAGADCHEFKHMLET